MIRLILGSASPRRRELLAQAGFTFTVHPAKGEEVITSTHPAEVVEELSLQKARQVADELLGGDSVEMIPGETVIIGADTVVAAEHRILGKPADREEAFRMIDLIQGERHQVYTGVTFLFVDRDKNIHTRTFHECTDVDVYDMSKEEIEAYIATPEPYDKAGAYGIQGSFGVFVRGIHGCYYNVVGLPIARLRRELNLFVREEGLQ